MRIRQATAADLPAILTIYGYYVENSTATFEYEVPSLAELSERFSRLEGGFPYLVAEEDGAVLGYSYAEPAFVRKAYAWDADISIYVHRDAHRRGIARALYTAVEELLKAQGFYTVYALITGSNAASLRFHASMGYREVGRLPNTGFKHGTWQDVCWLEKALRPREGVPAPTLRLDRLPEAAWDRAILAAQSLIKEVLQQ